MAERITPERSLDLQTTRKPSDWSDCEVAKKLTGTQRTYLKGLLLYPRADEHLPMADLVKPGPDGGMVRMPQRFVLKHKGCYYYINTEGYSYCRYVLRIPAELFGEQEPLIQEIVHTPVEEEPAYEEEEKESAPPVDTKHLVLCANVLIGWLEVNGYPKGTKPLAKALQRAIQEIQ